MSGGGGKGGSSKIGYKYFMGAHLVLCHGPVDSVTRILFGERVAATPAATSSQQIYIDKYELFGGENREGGVQGYVDIMMGDEDQPINNYLSQVVGGTTTTVNSSGSPIIFAVIEPASSADGTVTGMTKLWLTDSDGNNVTENPPSTAGSSTVYTMTITPNSNGSTTYVVQKTVTTTSSSKTTTLYSGTDASGETTDYDAANDKFVRNSTTTSDTDALTGVETQTTTITSSHIPAYRGVLSLVFRNFMFAAMNPYFKSVWVGVKRILKGWENNTVWYSAKAAIGDYDMNPAHIIYQVMTDSRFGMGTDTSNLNDTVFKAAADQLYTEGFGLSLQWNTQTSIKDFIQEICNTINAVVRINILTGLYELILIRDDYDIADLVELNVDNATLTSFQRAAWGELCTEVIVQYTGRDEEQTTIAVQDYAALAAQGMPNSTTKEYPGIREDALAVRVGQRDLAVLSSPLAKITIKCDRRMYAHEVGDVFALTWTPRSISQAAFRITKIDKGNLLKGEITIDAVEDVFGLPDSSYATAQVTTWVDPVKAAHVLAYTKLVESPYWDVIRNISAANFATLPSDYGFVQFLAQYGSGSANSFNIYGAASDTTTAYTKLGGAAFAPRATVSRTLTKVATTVAYVGAVGIDTTCVGQYAYIDDEAVSILSVNETAGTMTVGRGVLDTVPATHAVGAPIWVAESTAYDYTVRESAEKVYYRGLPITSLGELSIGSATAVNITLSGRSQRPFPPGQFKIDGNWYPGNMASPAGSITVTWAHRNRLTQTVTLQDYTTASIATEAGVTYTLVVMTQAGTVLRTYAGLTSASQVYTVAEALADGQLQVLRFQLYSVRDSLQSWQIHDHIITRQGLGFNFGQQMGGLA